MVTLTLWLSKKARRVVDTAINLSRQGDGRKIPTQISFKSSIVKGSTNLVNLFGAAIPPSIQAKIDQSFQTPTLELSEADARDLPAFDLIRASINLAVAGVLISIATGMKLPLSTTYVTFMVAMGTSLADRAWGRESAVYRVAGVVNVIGGWFMTALFAFLFAGTLVYIIHLGRGAAVAVLLILTAALIIRNYLKHRRETAVPQAGQEGLTKAASKTVQGIVEESSDNVAKSIYRTSRIFNGVVEGLSNHDAPELKKMVKRVA